MTVFAMLPARLQSVEGLSGILERAFKWEADKPISWRSCGVSLLVHMLVFLPWLPTGLPFRTRSEPRNPAIFRPAPGQVVAPRIARLVPVPSPPVPMPEPGFSPEQVHVELRSITLSFAPDTRGEFPQVVQAQHGMLALLDKDDRDLVRYVLEPPDWRARATLRDAAGYFPILMVPAEKWQVFREASRRDGIDLGRYQACALFGSSFMQCIRNAILAWAADRTRSGRVASAKLGISAGRPCGVEVLEVSFASK